eukprot:2052421-Amphidinium_carterae.1
MPVHAPPIASCHTYFVSKLPPATHARSNTAHLALHTQQKTALGTVRANTCSNSICVWTSHAVGLWMRLRNKTAVIENLS